MAITVQMREQVSQLYVALFGRAPDGEGLGYWVGELDAGKTLVDVANTMYATAPARVLYPSFLTNQEIIGNFYTNVLGRTADAEGLAFWTAKLNAAGATAGSVIAEMINVVANYSGTDPAGLTSQALFNNKVAVAQWYGEQNGNIAGANTVLTAVTSDPASIDAAKAGGAQSGETFMLTKDIDLVTGTSGNDTIRGVLQGTDSTLNELDEINGGAGIDTLKISNSIATTKAVLPIMSGVEVVEYSSTDTAQIDTSAYTDVTTLNIVKVGATKAVNATAANTTDINVTLKAVGAAVDTVGGKNVTVKLTDVAGTADVITVGKAGLADGAAGDVVVEATGAAYADGDGDNVLSAINVNGGKTISVTQKATSDASGAAVDTVGATITQGLITIVAGTTTTDITVKQDADVDEVVADETTGGVTATTSVKFVDIKANDKVVLGDGTDALTFTASEDMLAADVAKAFANLSLSLVKPSDMVASGAADAVGDTQGSAAQAKGVFSGSLGSWSFAAAVGDTVVFTFETANAPVGAGLDLVDTGTTIASSKTLTLTPTTGKAHDATPAGGVLGIEAGVVDITADAAVTTITVDGYDVTAAAATNNIRGAGNTKLATINLSNGGGMTIASAAATLALNLENVNGGLDFTAAPATLNIKSTGDNEIGVLDAAATTALNVSGTGLLDAGTTVDLTAAKTIKVTETAGLTLADGATLTALTSVDTTGTTGTVTMTIDGTAATYAGGAGVDNLTLDGDNAVSKAINLGGGNDRLDMTELVTAAKVPTVDVDGGAGDADVLVLAAASADKAKLSADTTFGAKFKNFERLELGAAAADADVTLDKLGFTNYVITNGVAATKALTLDVLSSGATVVMQDDTTSLIAKVKDAADGLTDSLNLEMNNATKGVNSNVAAAVQADDVETLTLKVTDLATDTSPSVADTIDTFSLELNADAAKTLTITGNANVELDIGAVNGSAVKLATINASTLEGGLTAAATGDVKMTITGGKGADVLYASVDMATGKADELFGGDGNDTLYAGSNSAKLTGGAGSDLFILTDSVGDGDNGAFGGTKDSATYSTILDFKAEDLLQLRFNDDTDGSGDELVVVGLTKLDADVNDAVNPQSFIGSVMTQLKDTGAVGNAVWFQYGADTFIVVDSGDLTDGTFIGGQDLIIKLAGVNGDNLSFNSDFGTVALI